MYVQQVLLLTASEYMYIQHAGTFFLCEQDRKNSMQDLLTAIAADGNATVLV